MIDLAADRARYDECAKKLLTYKAVIAWILKSCTKEFSQYSVNFICDNCLKENIEISSRAVHQDHPDRSKLLDGNEQIDCLNSEANAIKDQTVYYDIRYLNEKLNSGFGPNARVNWRCGQNLGPTKS